MQVYCGSRAGERCPAEGDCPVTGALLPACAERRTAPGDLPQSRHDCRPHLRPPVLAHEERARRILHRPRAGRAAGTIAWDGVRNYQARNFMRDAMQVGDGVLYWHSSCGRARHLRHRPHCRQPARRCLAVRPAQSLLRPQVLARQATLAHAGRAGAAQDTHAADRRAARASRACRHACTAKGHRLSITPVTHEEWTFIEGLLQPA